MTTTAQRWRRAQRLVSRSCAWLALLFIALCQDSAFAQTPNEDQVKAVYLYNFASFVNWPKAAFKDTRSPLEYCAVGGGAVANALRIAISGERVDGRTLALRAVNRPDELRGCHVLFISQQTGRGGEALLAAVDSYTLTVGDRSGFAQRGGMIELTRKNKRIRPLINMATVARSDIQISSKLLRLAKVISAPLGER